MLRFFTRIIIFFTFFLPVIAQAQGYKITLNTKNTIDSVLYLAHVYEQQISIDDTTKIADNRFVFIDDEEIPEGMYAIVNGKNEVIFDFFITSNKETEINVDMQHPTESLRAVNSMENNLYFDFRREVQAAKNKLDDAEKMYKQNPDNMMYLNKYLDGITEYNSHALKKYNKIFAKNKHLLAAKFIKLSIDPLYRVYNNSNKIPDSTSVNPIYKSQYLDNFPFDDIRIINTKLFTQKTDFYLDTLCIQSIESLKPEIDKLLLLSAREPDLQAYMAWYLLNKFEQPKFWGLDALYVYIYDYYIKSKKIKLLFPSMQPLIENKIKVMKPLLIGQPARQLMLKDMQGNTHDLLNVDAKYTVLLFWSTRCSHCRHEIPEFDKLYKELHTPYNMEIFSVSTDTSYNQWTSYLKRNPKPWINVFGRKPVQGNYFKLYNVITTPTIYIFDDKKQIIGKQIPPDKIKTLIIEREKNKNMAKRK